LTAFGLAMTIALDPSAALDYSVFTAATAALLLGLLSLRSRDATEPEKG
jgi:hypothetical protein